MSFSEHLDNFLKQRDQQPRSVASPASRRRQPVIQEPTNQSIARDAIAKAQEEASHQATLDTKAPHVRINGRYVIANEAQAIDQLKPQSKPADPNRIHYIEQLRKELKLKKRQS